LTLEDCIQEAVQHNLGLQVARYGPLIAQNNLSLAYAGYDPTLDISGRYGNEIRPGGLDDFQRIIPPSEEKGTSLAAGLGGLLPWGMTYDLTGTANNSSGERFGGFDTNGLPIPEPFETTSGRVSATVTQPLLRNAWIDGTRLTITLRKHDLGVAREEERRLIIEVVNRVELAYYDLVSALESLKVQEKALELSRKLLDENRERVEVGAMAPLEQKQAEAEVAANEAELLSAEQVLALRENALKRAITDDYAQWHAVRLLPADEMSATPQSFDLQDSWNKGLTMRPEIVQQWLRMEQNNIQLKYFKNQLYPQLDAFATYGYSGSDVEFSGLFSQYTSGSQPYWNAGARLLVPLSNVGARANHRNARIEIERSVLAMKDQEQMIMAEIDDAMKFAKVSYRRVAATRTAREFAEASLEAEEEKLANGKSTSFEVLRIQRDLTSARSSEIGALTEYNKALATLAQREGSTLERHRIEVEED